jgi:hypothetical protein
MKVLMDCQGEMQAGWSTRCVRLAAVVAEVVGG